MTMRLYAEEPVRPGFGIPVHIDNRVAPTAVLTLGGRDHPMGFGARGVIVNVETYWHLRYSPRVARFACELRRRTRERLR